MSKLDLEVVFKPTGEARGLPNKYYTDKDLFLKEQVEIFHSTWAAIGFSCDVPDPGDAKPIDFAGMPLLLLRDKTGDLKVFQNTCRHRGMILVDEAKNLKGPIRCPYHSWAYDFAGDLVATPHVGGVGIDNHECIKKENLGLFTIRTHVWLGVVFVNVSGNAPAFEKEHDHLLNRWSEFNKPLHASVPNSSFEMRVKSNWKLAAENYCESYHLPWIHPGLNSYSRLEDHYNIADAENYSGQGSSVYRQLKSEDGTVFPDFENISSKWDATSEYVTLFPNILLGVHRDHTFAMILLPQSPEETLERVALYYADPSIASEKWTEMVLKNSELWKTVFNEDVGVVEGMQKGRQGIKFDGGKFSPIMDVPTHVFHKWVANKLWDAI
ncbi:MAG: aromatic ring-hydroxylating dioxygenase subunit alpha [Acidimicrobiales bacterium]|nr:aromatic ring-hydroxylating dioxygenase subunit alpha [Hyphomonadaceae bacterium]RZV44636.1 MAG: aromatic ring-hydroxylating dioxygenase subunit alpha [Acidimicrobiales bacterium]